MYQVYLLYRGTLGTDGTRIFGSISFLQKWSLQKLDADKSSGIPPAADIDLIGEELLRNAPRLNEDPS